MGHLDAFALTPRSAALAGRWHSLASQSITKLAAAKLFFACPCPLWSAATGPIRAIPPIEGLDGGQDMGGVGALAAYGVEEPLVTTQRQHRLDQEEFGMTCDQAPAELAQNRGIKARVGQIQGQSIFPVN